MYKKDYMKEKLVQPEKVTKKKSCHISKIEFVSKERRGLNVCLLQS